MGKKLDAARRELNAALSALERMKVANDLAEFDDCWKEILGKLARFWNKTLVSLKGDTRLTNSPHVKRVNTDLKHDPLVQYLARARDANEHNIEPITRDLEAGFQSELTIPGGGKAIFRNVKVTIGDGPAQDVRFPGDRFMPAEVVATSATSRKVTYPVPASHQGTPLHDTSLLTLAGLGIAYYADFLERMVQDGWDQEH